MSLALKVSAYNRTRKWNLFQAEIQPGPSTRLLDVGFSEKEYSSTDNYIEKFYPWPEMVTALGVDKPVEFSRRYPKVKAVQYDGTRFPFDDQSFDVCWSNAVIEHVGQRERQVYFLKEIRRVAKRAFFTTPNRFFPVETHTRTPFLHWLPKPVFDRYLHAVGKGWAAGDYMYLLSEAELRLQLKMAGIDRYRLLHNRMGGFTLDFVVVF